MLTTPEGGAERTKAEDDGEASDGNEQEPGKMRRVLGCDVAMMRARQHSQPWEAGPGGAPALVWLWWLEEEETEETRQTLNVNPTVKVGTIVS